ncbi:MAG: M18 family aminopeptidase [Christensenellaceae bacterium]|nr:M18 family aminopeptidase [Christensenellaceae bacterium]
MKNDINGLISLLEKSVSPYHAAEEAMRLLDAEGFTFLEQSKAWSLERGRNYYVKCFGTMLLAFHVGSEYTPGEGFRLAASHTDWPCYYIKPNPEQVAGDCLKISIEPYGGMIHNTWLDRPLSAAGVVTVKTENVLEPERRLVNFVKPILTIPNLAIHMNRNVNKGVELNPNKDMLPIAATIEGEFNKDGFFVRKLAELMGVEPESILSYDLCLYNAEKPILCGFDESILTSPRLDNLTSTFAILAGIAKCERKHGITAAILFDNEEVGSGTKQGADSATLGMMLEKIAIALGSSRAEFIDSLTSGFMLSCDVAHSKHPNHGELADNSCNAVMNKGVALKMNYEQRYATEAVGIGIIEGLCKKYEIPYQRYMNRPDMRGGGTLGSYAASQLGMSTADIGVPMLAMHSSRETMGARDQASINELVLRYFCEE